MYGSNCGGLRQLVRTKRFLSAVICYSVLALLTLYNSISGGAGILSQLAYYTGYSGFRRLGGGLTMGALIAMIPMLLVLVGLWLIYASEAAGTESYRGTGMLLIRIYCIIEIVILGLIALVLVIICIGGMAGLGSLTSAAYEYGLSRSDMSGVTGASAGLLLLVLLLGCGAMALGILFYLKLMKMLVALRQAMEAGSSSAWIPMYVVVLIFIGGGAYGISALFCLGDPLSLLMNGCNSAAQILFALLLLECRRGVASSGAGYTPSAPAAPVSAPASVHGATAPLGIQQAAPSAPAVNNSGAYLVRVSNRKRYPVNKSFLTIGRDPARVDLSVTDNPMISGVHAGVGLYNGQFCLMDNNSTNHTFVNGKAIAPKTPVPLANGSRFRLSDEEFIFVVE